MCISAKQPNRVIWQNKILILHFSFGLKCSTLQHQNIIASFVPWHCSSTRTCSFSLSLLASYSWLNLLITVVISLATLTVASLRWEACFCLPISDSLFQKMISSDKSVINVNCHAAILFISIYLFLLFKSLLKYDFLLLYFSFNAFYTTCKLVWI